jgi:hypothetical protein
MTRTRSAIRLSEKTFCWLDVHNIHERNNIFNMFPTRILYQGTTPFFPVMNGGVKIPCKNNFFQGFFLG